MPAVPLLVFDLDGTMIDTATDLIAALNDTMAEEGLQPIPVTEVGHLVGAGGRVMIERGLRHHGIDPVSRDIDALQARFVRHYSRAMPGASKPYPGAIAALDLFEAAGWRFAVCTNKAETLARQLLEALNLTPRLAAICGGDTFAVRKPDAGHLLGTVRLAGGDPARTIMVGDSRADIEAAKNADLPIVAVTFGYTDRPVRDFSPDVTIDHFDQLWDAVRSLSTESLTHVAV
jgi:phosphoglycolate phosphatase